MQDIIKIWSPSRDGPVSLRNSIGESDKQRKKRIRFAESMELDFVGHLPLILVAAVVRDR